MSDCSEACSSESPWRSPPRRTTCRRRAGAATLEPDGLQPDLRRQIGGRRMRPANAATDAASFSCPCEVGLESTSTPRSWKIAPRGRQRVGEIRGCNLTPPRQRGFGLAEGPIEPRRQRRKVGALDRAAAPDAQPRRRIAVRRDVVSDAVLFQRGDHALHERPLRVGVERGDRRIDDLQANGSVRARRATRAGFRSTASGDQRTHLALAARPSACRPPADLPRRAVEMSSTPASGRVVSSPSRWPRLTLPPMFRRRSSAAARAV